MTVRSFVLLQNPAYRPGESRPLLLVAALVAAAASLAACAPRIQRQGPAPAAQPPIVDASLVKAWRITPSLLAREYLVRQHAMVESTTEQGTVRDTTSVETDVLIRETVDGGTSGLIRRVLLSAPGGSPVPFPGLRLPLAFAVVPRARGVLGTPESSPVPMGGFCRSAVEAPLSNVRDLLLRLPDTVVITTSWSDSGSYRTCRDGAVLTVVSRRTFRVRAFTSGDDDGTLVVDHTTRTTIRGSAARGEDTTAITGTGTGSMVLVVHAKTGAIVSGSGSSSLEITVRGTTATERARQSLQTLITRLDR